MKQLLIPSLFVCTFLSCTSTKVLNEQDVVVVVENTCVAPPPQFVPEGFEASAQAVIPKIEETLNAELSVGQKVREIRKVTPEVYNFQVMEYSLCQSVEQGRLDKSVYQEFLRTMINKIFSNVPDVVSLEVNCRSRESKQPIAGANIVVKDASVTARTDMNGKAIINIPRTKIGEEVTLMINYISHTPLEDIVEIKGTMNTINIFI